MAKPKKPTEEVDTEELVETPVAEVVETPVADVPVEAETPVTPVASKEQKKPKTKTVTKKKLIIT